MKVEEIDINSEIGIVGTIISDYEKNRGILIHSLHMIQEDNGSVTVFAFDAGQGLSEHTAPFDALVLILDGEAEIIISGKVHAVRAGEAILMPADEPHALKAVSRFKMMLTMVKR